MLEKRSIKTRFYVREMGRGEITHIDTSKSIMASDQHQEIIARAMLIESSLGDQVELVDVKTGYENAEPFAEMIENQEKVNIVEDVTHETIIASAFAHMVLRITEELLNKSDAALQTNS